MKMFMGAAAVAMMLAGAPLGAQTATATKTTSKVTTSNGQVTSATATTQKASCRNDKGQFIKCAQVTQTRSTAAVTRDSNGKCHFAAGPKKGQFTKCP